MTVDLTAAEFHDPIKAREWLEGSRWPNGANCSHCGSVNVLRMEGKAHRPGLFHCRDCRGQFTVLTGSVMESSHIPLNKWVLAIRRKRPASGPCFLAQARCSVAGWFTEMRQPH